MLEEFNEIYKNIEIDDNKEFDKIPYGTYKVLVHKLEIRDTKDMTRKMLSWQLKIVEGALNGRIIFKNTVIQENTMKMIKGDLMSFDVALENISDLYDNMHRYLDLVIAVEVKQNVKNPQYDNVYFRKLVGSPAKEKTIYEQSNSDPRNFNDIPF